MITKRLILAVGIAGMTALSAPAATQFTVESEEESFIVASVVENLESPWGLAFLPEDRGILVTQRTGDLLLIRDGRKTIVSGTPEVAVIGQGGLLDVVLSPNFTTDSLVYLSFSESGRGGVGTAIFRGRLVDTPGSPARLTNPEVMYRALPKSGGGRHFGSRLAFDEAGYLYVTLGERGSMNRAQDTEDPYGSVLRLNPDGSIPSDNPGFDAPEIWSYGHRNAQGLAKHPGTGDIWLHEHGPKGGDEVNIVRKGANYGWPRVTYGIDYNGSVISNMTSAPGFEEPVVYWVPSIAPSGMAFYDGDVFPEWNGNIFVGALAGQHLRRLELRGNRVVHQEVLLSRIVGRIRDVRRGPDGMLYL
ncbi:MAG: PQQ-dependent sugar dehydrogenase, partial [Spirochaetaceae bacterium]|nr:PQQ-dependent sugar dehydrogenase [Spirochaetaceae bacterium]